MKQLPVLLLGAGGHARVVLDLLVLRGYRLAGVFAPELELGGQWFGVNSLGGDEAVAAFSPDQVLLVNGLGAVPGQNTRQSVQRRFVDQGYRFISLIHPSVIVAQSAEIADGVQLMAGSVIQPGVRIGAATVVNTGARIDHDCCLGEHVFVGPGAIACGDVSIQTGVFIGAGAILLPGVTIGTGAVVGGGAVVVNSVEAGMKVVGNPARSVN